MHDGPGGSPTLEAMQHALLDYASEFVIFVDRRGGVVLGAGDGLHALGYGPTDQQGTEIAAAVHPDDRPAVTDLIARAQSTPHLDEEIEVRARRKDDSWILLEARVTTVVRHPVLGTGAIVRIRQVAESDRDAPPPSGENRFRSLAAALPIGVISVDPDDRVVDANDSALSLLRRSVDDLVGSGWVSSVHPEDASDVDDARQLLDHGARQAEAVVRVDVEGRVRWMHLTLVGLGEGSSEGYLVAFDDITERHHATAALTHRATHDALTGLPNRTLLEDRLHQACARLAELDRSASGRSVTLLFGDLDHFKDVNDRLGHAVGDRVLRHVAARLAGVVRASDTVTRLGGDEFVVVCEDLDPADAAELAHRVAAVVRQPIEIDGHLIEVSISVGIVASSSRDTDPYELLARADAQMYQRKQAGPPQDTDG